MALKLIRKNNQDEVSAYEDAVLFHQAKGKAQGGVFQGVYNEFGHIADNVNYKFIIKSGMGMLYGRQFELPDNETYALDLSGMVGQLRHYVVYIEINTNTNPESISIKTSYNTASYPTVTTGTDLYRNKLGIARIVLYKFRWNYTTIQTVIKDFYIYQPGKSQEAESIGPNGKINTRTVSDLVHSDKDWVKYAENASSAVVAQAIGSTKNIVSDELKFTQRNTWLVQGYTYTHDLPTNGISPGNTQNVTISKPAGTIIAINVGYSGEYTKPISVTVNHVATGQAHPDFMNGKTLFLADAKQSGSYMPMGGFTHDDTNVDSVAEFKLTGSTLSIKAVSPFTLKGQITLTLMVIGG